MGRFSTFPPGTVRATIASPPSQNYSEQGDWTDSEGKYGKSLDEHDRAANAEQDREGRHSSGGDDVYLCAPALAPENGKEFWVRRCSFLAGAQTPGPCVARAVPAAARPAAGEGLRHTGVWRAPGGFAPRPITPPASRAGRHWGSHCKAACEDVRGSDLLCRFLSFST